MLVSHCQSIGSAVANYKRKIKSAGTDRAIGHGHCRTCQGHNQQPVPGYVQENQR